MRSIAIQGDGGYHLNHAHANPPQTPLQATNRWAGFAHKGTVLQSLLTKQYQLCCYSELRADQEGLGYHIEHIENKSQNPPRTFDYDNLAASALDSTIGLSTCKAQRVEVFGGHASGKQQACDINRFVSCRQPDCLRFFAYLSDGRVVPARMLSAQEQHRAQYTIDTLNLNSPYLLTRRRQRWDEVDSLFQEHAEKGWSLLHLVYIELTPVDGGLSPFFSLTRQFFGEVAEQTLLEYAPELV